MRNWKVTGLFATLAIVLAFPLYLVRMAWLADHGPVPSEAQFVGAQACIECHKLEYDLWNGSHHDLAMDHATEGTVLGDFNDAVFEHQGRTHKFYKRDGRFFVYTDGPDGKMAEFEVLYTFGWTPLQQYLVPFPDGKLQTLALTWHTIHGEWYHMADAVYPDEVIDHNNWLHWTRMGQNWNGMCADCHSTNLHKGYDFEMNTFNTTWSEIDVSCEACHGPSSFHLDWAQLPDMARPMNTNYGLVVQTSNINHIQYVDQCARCHTRRMALKDYDHEWHDLLDHMVPELVREPMYFADGQILEEDYVYGSFVQSKMYMNEVQCNDCHNAHSLKLIKTGNDLCLQCHLAEAYDTYNHHFHRYRGEPGQALAFADDTTVYEVGEGALCINCHMPGRYYMGVDFRRDHSFRVPRPDLSDELNTPNACIQCHRSETNQWAAAYLRQWYGISIKPHYGTALAAGHLADPEAFDQLVTIVSDQLYPPIIRATALSVLGEFYTDRSMEVLRRSLQDPESMIRHSAARNIPVQSQETINDLLPLLNDHVRAVRMEAAVRLSFVPEEMVPRKHLRALSEALDEYRAAMEYTGDFAASRHNLGNWYYNQGDFDEAEKNFLAAIEIDDQFYPAQSNLAILYNRQGKNDKAEMLLRNVLKANPDNGEMHYSLGLLLAEQQKYAEATNELMRSAELIPDRPRIWYNLGLLHTQLGNRAEAEQALLHAYGLDEGNFDFIYALVDFYINGNDLVKAREFADILKDKYPDNQVTGEILQYLERVSE
jgi:Tfp pilus assembly protein PilF